MCELLGRGPTTRSATGCSPSGLLSVADALLDAPMEEVLESLPLSEEITGALLRHEGRRGRVLSPPCWATSRATSAEGPTPTPPSWPTAYLPRCAGPTRPGRWIGELRPATYGRLRLPRPLARLPVRVG